MPKYEVIIVDVSPTGQVVIKTEGFTGKACLAATAKLKAALGTVTEMVSTPEMNVVQQQEQRNVAKRKQ